MPHYFVHVKKTGEVVATIFRSKRLAAVNHDIGRGGDAEVSQGREQIARSFVFVEDAIAHRIFRPIDAMDDGVAQASAHRIRGEESARSKSFAFRCEGNS